MKLPKIDWGAVGKRLLNWGKKKAAEEAQAELDRRLGTKRPDSSRPPEPR